jgi:hypothetical protein
MRPNGVSLLYNADVSFITPARFLDVQDADSSSLLDRSGDRLDGVHLACRFQMIRIVEYRVRDDWISSFVHFHMPTEESFFGPGTRHVIEVGGICFPTVSYAPRGCH